MRLSHRLQFLLDRCEPGLPVWDLCCDHGYLGLAALASGRFPRVVFNDIVEHVLEDLRLRLRLIRTRATDFEILCSAAEDLTGPLTGNVVLAGIGGERILKILRAQSADGRLKARHIVACPEKDAEWLAEQVIPGYKLVERLAIPHGKGVRWIQRYQLAFRDAVRL